jgi:16S rRNA (cytosine967-C5)-methyltransferase
MSVSGREAAYRALAMWRKNHIWSEAALDTMIKNEGMDTRDGALATRICYGVLQNQYLCDYYISCYSAIPLEKIQPQVLDILRLSVYQLLFLNKVPANAAVNEGVELTKKHANRRAASFVNAVLRKISANSGKLPQIPDDKIDAYLSIKYSHPLWLVRRFLEILDRDGTEAFLQSNNITAPTVLQVNTLRVPSVEPVQIMALGDVQPHPWLADCYELYGGGNITVQSLFQNGYIYIQDAAARLAVTALNPQPGETILDGCAAPGGKSFSAAIFMRNQGKIASCDIHENKLSRIREGTARLGIEIIESYCMDAGKPNKRLQATFDGVIADVPCSGIGIIRKKPEIRYKTASEIAGLPNIQLRILNNLATYVRPGGRLVYSTCTVMPEENELIIRQFLAMHPEYIPEAFALPEPIGRVACGMITLWPHLHGTDGFFICKLRRKG